MNVAMILMTVILFSGLGIFMLWFTSRDKKERIAVLEKFAVLAGFRFRTLGYKFSEADFKGRSLQISELPVQQRYPGEDILFKHKIRVSLSLKPNPLFPDSVSICRRSHGSGSEGGNNLDSGVMEFDQEYLVSCNDEGIGEILGEDLIERFLDYPGWSFSWQGDLAWAESRRNPVLFPENLHKVLMILYELGTAIEDYGSGTGGP